MSGFADMATCREEKNHYLRKAAELRVLSLGRKTGRLIKREESKDGERREQMATRRTLQADPVGGGDTATGEV